MTSVAEGLDWWAVYRRRRGASARTSRAERTARPARLRTEFEREP